MGKIVSNYKYNLLYQFVVLIVPIITAPYLARILGATNLGIYSFIFSITSILNTITVLGTYNYGNRQIAYERDNNERLNQIFWEIAVIRLILGVIGTSIYLIIAINSQYKDYFILYYPWLLASFLDTSWLYIGVENMKPTALKSLFAKIVSVIAIFVFVKSADDLGIYISILAITTLLSNISLFFQLKSYVRKPNIDLSNFWSHIKGSLFLLLPQVASMLYLQVDKVMIEGITGLTNQVSFFDNAEKIVTIPLTFITVMSTVLMPRIANEFRKGNIENIRFFLIKSGDLSLYIAFPMMFGLIVIAKDFIPWYLGAEFLPVATAIMIISPIIVSNSLAGISGNQYFTATNQINILLRALVVAAVFNIIVNALLIPKFEFYGAAVATVISSYLSVWIQFKHLNKQISMKELLGKSVKYFIMSLVMAVAIILATYQFEPSILLSIGQVVLGILVYLIISYFLKVDIFFELVSKGKALFKSKS